MKKAATATPAKIARIRRIDRLEVLGGAAADGASRFSQYRPTSEMTRKMASPAKEGIPIPNPRQQAGQPSRRPAQG